MSHSLSVVVLQADGAANVLRSDPGRAERALVDIGRTTRQRWRRCAGYSAYCGRRRR